MIQAASILPLCAGLIGLALAILTVSARRIAQLTREQLLFTLMCASHGAWALSVAVHASVRPQVLYPTLLGDTPAHHALEVFLTTCVITSSVFWLLFTAAHTGRERLTRGTPLVVMLLPIAYTALAASTNPAHGLFYSVDARTGVRILGLLAFPHVLLALSFLGVGTVMFVQYGRSRQLPTERRGAFLVAASAGLVFLGNAAWLTKGITNLGLVMNPAPSLLVIVDVVLAIQTLRHGMVDVLPRVVSSTLSEIPDGVIHLDEHLRVVSANPAALRLLPELHVGVRIHGIDPRIAQHAQYCLDYSTDDLTFELANDRRTLWGRLCRIPEDNDASGCVVILTDLTELRALQVDLVRHGQPLDGQTPTSDYFDRLARQVGGRPS